MINFIPQRASKLIIFLAYFILFSGCNASTAEHLNSYSKVTIVLPDGTHVPTYIAETRDQQTKGLSAIMPKDFKASEAMLFPEKEMMMRQFWMPNTHFDLDVIFMNEDYYVLDIHRNVKHFPRQPKFKGEVPLSKTVFSQHVLEIKASSELSKLIQPGMQLKMMKSQNP